MVGGLNGSRNQGRRKGAYLSYCELWQIWKDRNSRNFKRKQKKEVEIVQKDMQEWREFLEAKKVEDGKSSMETKRTELASGQGSARGVCAKINIDATATINVRNRKTGWGIVARDGNGTLLKTWAEQENKMGDAVVEQALAIRAAI
ncbi:hypothetical protein ACH5RR_006341 [Cinchona calisaya]|uniref:RNase H type-1 domain-containing protein n=1 Tax=Cinchona calisaya TaxID=153742 RepID=A0ABD3ANQ5_9GENT